MSSLLNRFTVVTTLLLLLPGCPEDPREQNRRPPVVSIQTNTNPAVISQLDFLQALTWAGAGRVEVKSRRKLADHVLTRAIDALLIEEYANENGISIAEKEVLREVRRVRSRYQRGDFELFVHNEQMTLKDHEIRVRKRMLSDKVLQLSLKERVLVSDDDLQKAYQERVVEKPKPEQVRVRQILVATEEEAAHVLNEVKRRRISFDEAAKRYSDGPEGEQGGDLGWFSKKEMPKVFEVCFSLPLQKVSTVISSYLGFHIFQVVGKRAAGFIPSLIEVRKKLSDELRREKEGLAVKQFIKSLRKKTNFQINEEAVAATLNRLPAFKAEKVEETSFEAGHTHNNASPADQNPSSHMQNSPSKKQKSLNATPPLAPKAVSEKTPASKSP